jgi:glycosyltransferase involved in cell wall biosynthesis
MTRPQITVTIIALNEQAKIGDAISSVSWADEVVVVDSGSTDQTREIATRLGAKVLFHAWEGYGQQKNFAQDQASHDWVLNIDADEVVSTELKQEIFAFFEQCPTDSGQVGGFEMPRKTFYLGRWIRHGGWYPNYLVRLANRQKARWSEPNVHEELRVRGRVERLKSPLLHDPFNSISDQILTNLSFSRLGSLDLKSKGQKPSLIRLVLKPIGKFLETYFLKRGFLDGLPGFIISVNAAHSIFLKYAYLMETELRTERSHC